MFDGALVSVPDMPWSYLPTLFALQLPEVLLALLLAGIVGTFMSLSRTDVPARRKTIFLMLTLAATLPLVIAMVKRPALYNGIRHFVFVIPPMAVLAGVSFAWGMNWLKDNHRRWQPAALAVFTFGLLLPLSEMIRLHPYEYTHFNHIAGTVRTADNFFMLDYWGLALKQASDGLREELVERQESPPQGRKWKVAVCGPQRPAQVALGPDFTIGWDSQSADFAMTLGEFYCKGLDRARHGGNQARRCRVRARLRYSRPRHLDAAGDSGAVAAHRRGWHDCRAGCPPCCPSGTGLGSLLENQQFLRRSASCRQPKLA